MIKLTLQFISSLNSAIQKLTGYRRRQLAAEVCEKYFGSSPTKMERVLTVGRAMVQLGLHEKRTGIRCLDAYNQRGLKKKKSSTRL